MEFLKKIRQIWPLFPAALYLLAFFIIVLSSLIVISFSTGPGITFPSYEPLHKVVNSPEFSQALIDTAIFVLIGTPLELIVGFFLALLLYNSFYIRNTIRAIFIIPFAVPALVTATLMFILFDTQGGFINHLLQGKYHFFPLILHQAVDWRGTKLFSLGLSLMGKIWRDMPISMLILLAGLNTIDTQLFDAAKTMGAGMRHRIRYIIIPLLIPSISAVVLLRSIEMWKEFIFPYILAGRYNLLSTLIEYLYINNSGDNTHEASLVALILVICIVLSALFFMWLIGLVNRQITDAER